MALRDKKACVYFFDILGLSVFFLPLLLDKILNRKKSRPPAKILLIELWGIGDLVMMSSILKPLRAGYPNAKITLLSKAYASDLLGTSENIDEFVEFDSPWTKFKSKYNVWRWDWKNLLKTIRGLKKEKFDLILDARGDIRNNLLSFLISGKTRLGYGWTGGGFFLTDNLKVENKGLHRIDAWVKLLKYLGLSANDCRPHLCVTKEEEAFADNFLKTNGISSQYLFIGIHPGARIKTRCWPLDRFAKVAEYVRDVYKSKVIIFLDPEGYGDEISIQGESFKVKLTLKQLIVVFKKLDLLVCNDGGPMHIATAVNTPVVAIFGPTNPIWFGPYGKSNTVIIENNMPCRPCFDYCKKDKAVCLDSITVNKVKEMIGNVCRRKN